MKSRGVPPPNDGTSFYKPVGGAYAPTKYDPGHPRRKTGPAKQRMSEAIE